MPRNAQRTTAEQLARQKWSNYAADEMFYWEFAEGSGDDITDVNGSASDDYAQGGVAATSPTWSAERGVSPAGDGGWLLPVDVNRVFQLDRPTTVVIGFWIESNDALASQTITSGSALFSAGIDNNNEANGPSGGMFYLQFIAAASKYQLQSSYRNNSADASAPSNQINALTAANFDAAVHDTYERHFGAARLVSDGTTVTLDLYQNNDISDSFTLTENGTGPMSLDSERQLCAIGGRVISLPNPTFRLPLNANAGLDFYIRNLLLWRKDGATDAESTALINELFRYPMEPPRGI